MKKNITPVSAITQKYLRSNGFKRTITGFWINLNNNVKYSTADALEIIGRRERRVLENSPRWTNVGSNQWVYSLDARSKYYTRTEAFIKETK
jgi:hypothetical protein